MAFIPGKRIIILGSPGSGKSTLARALREKTGLELFHLDQIWWKPDRTHITREAFDDRLRQILAGDAWMIDGDFSRTDEVRFAACDTVIFLDMSEETCMRGIRERVGKVREDIPWIAERLDPELEREVRTYRLENRPRILELMEKYPVRRLIFRTREQAEAWISALPPLESPERL